MDYGFLVPSDLARQVLQSAGVPPEQVFLPVEGLYVTYQGKPFTILEREYYMPPDSNSPDGWHIVYSPTEQEVSQHEENQNPSSVNWADMADKLLNVALIGIGAYAIGKITGIFKRY